MRPTQHKMSVFLAAISEGSKTQTTQIIPSRLGRIIMKTGVNEKEDYALNTMYQENTLI